MANLGAMDTGGFVQIWRVAWRDLRQQRDVLKMLYEQVALNADTGSLPPPPAQGAPHGLSEQLQWVEAVESSQGARDAYATAVVMFVDDLLKRVYGAYKAAGGPEPLTVGLRGVPLHRLFKSAGNNVRHYADWDKAWELASTDREKRDRRQMSRDVKVLAQALDHAQPVETKYLRTYAQNRASQVLLELGDGSYEAVEQQIQAALMEMVTGLGSLNDRWVQLELRQGTVAS